MAKKRTLSMSMEPQFDFQPEGPDQKKQHQPQSVLGSNFVKINPLGNIESHPEVVDFELRLGHGTKHSFCSKRPVSSQ